jgi:hypothetical protein
VLTHRRQRVNAISFTTNMLQRVNTTCSRFHSHARKYAMSIFQTPIEQEVSEEEKMLKSGRLLVLSGTPQNFSLHDVNKLISRRYHEAEKDKFFQIDSIKPLVDEIGSAKYGKFFITLPSPRFVDVLLNKEKHAIEPDHFKKMTSMQQDTSLDYLELSIPRAGEFKRNEYYLKKRFFDDVSFEYGSHKPVDWDECKALLARSIFVTSQKKCRVSFLARLFHKYDIEEITPCRLEEEHENVATVCRVQFSTPIQVSNVMARTNFGLNKAFGKDIKVDASLSYVLRLE